MKKAIIVLMVFLVTVAQAKKPQGAKQKKERKAYIQKMISELKDQAGEVENQEIRYQIEIRVENLDYVFKTGEVPEAETTDDLSIITY